MSNSRATWERDLAGHLSPAGHIRVEVKISRPGSGEAPEPRETGVSARPEAVAKFLRELADDVERAAR